MTTLNQDAEPRAIAPVRVQPVVSRPVHDWETIGEEWLWDVLRCRKCGQEITENLRGEVLPECKPANADSSQPAPKI